MKIENVCTLERAAGTIEGIALSLENESVQDALFNAVEMIDAVLTKERAEAEGDI